MTLFEILIALTLASSIMTGTYTFMFLSADHNRALVRDMNTFFTLRGDIDTRTADFFKDTIPDSGLMKRKYETINVLGIDYQISLEDSNE